MACFNCIDKKMHDIEYVKKLAKALSLLEKQNVVIFIKYERGFGDIYRFEVETAQNRKNAVEIIKYEIPVIETIQAESVSEINGESDIQLQQLESGTVLPYSGNTELRPAAKKTSKPKSKAKRLD